MSSTLENYVIC